MSDSTPAIDLRPDYLHIVREILRKHIPDREVVVFGSRASGSARKYSDLDLAVLGDSPLTLSLLSALGEDFDESDLPFKVDVIDWAMIDEKFRSIIRRTSVSLCNLNSADEKR